MFDDGGDREKSQSQIVAVGEVLSFIQLTVLVTQWQGGVDGEEGPLQ